MQWASASMPVAAVMCGGRPTVSSGSEITVAGSIFGLKMIFLMWVASSRMTEARPTSEPVPAVVGTATMGATPAGSTRFQLSPLSSKSNSGRFWPAMRARSEEHTSELKSLMRKSYAVFCLKKKNTKHIKIKHQYTDLYIPCNQEKQNNQ